MSTEAVDTAAVLTAAREALEQYMDVHVDDDGALTFSHADVPCFVQATRLAEGLTMLSLNCAVAVDLAEGSELAESVAERAGQGLFGTLGIVRTDRGVDVTLRYAFPAQGMEATPLGVLLMLVVSTASQVRTDLLGFSSGESASDTSA